MFKPELYQKCNALTKKDALESLETYASKINWRTDDSAMDLGCGDGSVTTDVLKKFMHSNFKKLVGSDVSEKMVQFANEKYGDERTVFTMLDMAGDLPKKLISSFDHVFSFYAIHWVDKQECVFDNIYNLMKDSGDCLLVFVGYTPVYDIWRALSKNKRWQRWLSNVEYYVSPYQDSQEADKQVKRIMSDKGFINIDVKCIKKSYAYSLGHFKRTMEAIIPFKIPAYLQDEFMDDFMKVVYDLDLIENTNVVVNYTLITAYGCMFDAQLYHDNNEVSKRDSQEILEKYENKINWRADDLAIDLGCGDGSVTTYILKKFMHSKFKKLVGTDISETMVQFANKQHGDKWTEFTVFDMEGDLPDEFRNSFDHVFSFYAIHWVRNQPKVFSNINNLLKEGGDCLLAFLGNTLVYDIWRALSHQTKWQPWLGNVESFVSPYHDLQEPEKLVKLLMAEKGFRGIDVNCIHKTYVYNNVEHFKKTMEAISPYKIPSDQRVEFIGDLLQVAEDLDMVEKCNSQNKTIVTMKYDLIVANARKESSSSVNQQSVNIT